MTTFTTDNETPDHGPFHDSIKVTSGIYVRKNYTTDRLELWLDGNCHSVQVNANKFKPENDAGLGDMLEAVKKHYYKKGKRDAQDAMKKALGLK